MSGVNGRDLGDDSSSKLTFDNTISLLFYKSFSILIKLGGGFRAFYSFFYSVCNFA